MRIAIVLGPFLSAPPAPAGAVELVWTSLAKSFSKRGHDVAIICRRPDGSAQRDEACLEEYRYVRGYRRSGYRYIDLLLDAIYSLRALSSVPAADVVVLNTFFAPILLSLRVRPKYAALYNLARFPKGQFALYRALDGVMAVSQVVARALAQQSPEFASRTTVVPNPIDTNIFRLQSMPSGAQGSVPVVLYTGRLHPEKGLHVLVDACSQLANDHSGLILRLIGDESVGLGGGGERFLEDLRNRASAKLTLQMRKAVRDREELASVLRSCDVYCYPSMADTGESFGVAPLEAMGVGCAVVVSALECFQDFVRPGENAVVFDHRSEEKVGKLRDSIAWLLENRERAHELGRAAAADASRFSIEAVASRYEEAFKAAIARKHDG